MIKALLLTSLLATPLLVNEEVVETPSTETFEEKTYTFESYTLILTSDNECKIVENETEYVGSYVKANNDIILVINGKTYSITLNEDGTFKPFENKEVNEIWEDFKVWAKDWLSPEMITNIIGVATTITSVITLVVRLLRMAKEKTLTVEALRDELNGTIGDKIDATLKNELDNAIPNLVKTINNQKEIINVLCKVVALSQENSPQSRIAITELISTIGVDTSSSKQAIENEVKEQEAKKEKTNEELERIITNEK